MQRYAPWVLQRIETQETAWQHLPARALQSPKASFHAIISSRSCKRLRGQKQSRFTASRRRDVNRFEACIEPPLKHLRAAKSWSAYVRTAPAVFTTALIATSPKVHSGDDHRCCTVALLTLTLRPRLSAIRISGMGQHKTSEFQETFPPRIIAFDLQILDTVVMTL